jgi:hypothetical protein
MSTIDEMCPATRLSAKHEETFDCSRSVLSTDPATREQADVPDAWLFICPSCFDTMLDTRARNMEWRVE